MKYCDKRTNDSCSKCFEQYIHSNSKHSNNILPFSFKAKVLEIENKKAESEFYQLYLSVIQFSLWTETVIPIPQLPTCLQKTFSGKLKFMKTLLCKEWAFYLHQYNWYILSIRPYALRSQSTFKCFHKP